MAADLPEVCPFCKAPRWMVAEGRVYFNCRSSQDLSTSRYEVQSAACKEICEGGLK